jgi:hypothetical protein
MGSSLMVEKPLVSNAMRPATKFKREFKAFLAGIGFQLKHFLPDDNVDEKMFTSYLIPRATGYEKLRGQGGLSEELALQWALRSDEFIKQALKNGRRLSLEGISFIDYEGREPKVNWRKLIALYELDELEKLVPLRIKIDDSIDEVKVEKILSAIHSLVGDIQIAVSRVNEGCTEVTILVSRQEATEILSMVARHGPPSRVLSVKEARIPRKGSLERKLWLDGPSIDLARADALDRFAETWRRAMRIEWAIRPWRRLRWMVSPSIGSSPLARVMSESNERAYAGELRGKWQALKADLEMSCITWPLFAAVSLSLTLSALHAFFPFIAVGAGVATGLVLALVGSQVCACVLSPAACGAGTIGICWAFGVAQAFAIGSLGGAGLLSRAGIQRDLFISVTGGIVGLSAPDWLSRMPLAVVILLLSAIACAIAVSGWFMAQPAKSSGAPKTSGRRRTLGASAGAAMGGGIGMVAAIAAALTGWGWPRHIAFIAAFVLLGSATFAFTLRLQMPRLRKKRLILFGLSYALVAGTLCELAYQNAGGAYGLLALVAATAWYHATWFTAASVVGQRIGDARAAAIATTLEGALGFTAFVVFRLLQR